MEFPFQSDIYKEDDTVEVAKKFSRHLKKGDIVLLNGSLGSGKTFFVKHVCSEYGIKNVSSPSFSIVNEYVNSKKIFHFDFYRIKKITELYDIGFEDYINDETAVTFIEWAQLWDEILHRKSYIIDIDYDDAHKRKISIKKCQK